MKLSNKPLLTQHVLFQDVVLLQHIILINMLDIYPLQVPELKILPH